MIWSAILQLSWVEGHQAAAWFTRQWRRRVWLSPSLLCRPSFLAAGEWSGSVCDWNKLPSTLDAPVAQLAVKCLWDEVGYGATRKEKNQVDKQISLQHFYLSRNIKQYCGSLPHTLCIHIIHHTATKRERETEQKHFLHTAYLTWKIKNQEQS